MSQSSVSICCVLVLFMEFYMIVCLKKSHFQLGYFIL